MSTVHSQTTTVYAVVLLGALVAASAVGRDLTPTSSLSVPRTDQQEGLLAKLEEELVGEHRQEDERRLALIEESMRLTVGAMPKNEYGKLGNLEVHYVLHRFFVERHGWTAQGIMPPRGRMPMPQDSWKTAYPLGFLEDRVPPKTVDILENLLVQYGLGLHEVAVVALMLENLAHREARTRLQRAFHAHNLPFDSTIDVDAMDQVIDTYMASYVLGYNISQPIVGEVQPTWALSWNFVRKARRQVAGSSRVFDLSAAAEVIDRITERYAREHNRQCSDLKHRLVALDHLGSGSVKLRDFYDTAASFTEDLKYLTQLGALDDSDPNDPRVIVSNYINGPSNCMATSGNFSLCCQDECDALFSHLELMLQAPDAAPAEIAALVAALPSDTVAANRQLSSELIGSLDQIANKHGGRVQLRDRLFVEWMHKAYPNECEFPRTPFAKIGQLARQALASHHGVPVSVTVTTTFPPAVSGESTLGMVPANLGPRRRWLAASGVAAIALLATLAFAIIRIWRATSAVGATSSQNLLLVA